MTFKTKEIENKVGSIEDFSSPEFIYDLLLAYGKPKSSVTRLKLKTSGTYNLSKNPNEVYWKDNLLFKYIPDSSKDDLLLAIDDLSHDEQKLRYTPRFVIVTNLERLLAIDTRDYSSLDIAAKDLTKHYAFFLAWAGMDKSAPKTENEADVRAAERMANLYDEIIHHNIEIAGTEDFIHSLNVFFSRLLFCFFAEDTNIFSKNIFTQTVAQHTQADGGDLAAFLGELFKVLDTKDDDREHLPSHFAAFPYVNGKLFTDPISLPKFSAKARRLLIECGELSWAKINPDIFGSMIQAVVHPGERAGQGMHYTSVVNIMKVIEPLFIEDLEAEYEKYKDNSGKLWDLLKRLYAIKVFDPACGSGNFLIISYKELRRLEHKILQKLNRLGLTNLQSQIKLENFYGIEIDDFAHQIANLSLVLAKHQMNLEFDELFGTHLKLIPLKDSGSIICDNATRLDWKSVCPNDNAAEVYVIGNPPYLGSRNQKEAHKQDLKPLATNYKSLDYISAWFIKGADYIISSNSQLAFVSTNSITQGEQVAILWPNLLKELEIGFAYTSFKWSNNAKGGAGVICVIVNLRNKSGKQKTIYSDNKYVRVDHINAYLAAASDTYIFRRSKPISPAMPAITFGSMPNDDGNLILSGAERDQLLYDYPEVQKYVKRFIGSAEFLRGQERWCLVIDDLSLEAARKIEPIRKRLDNITKHRLESSEKSTQKLASQPNHFYFFAHKDTDSIIIPSVSSERREYIPMGFLNKNTVISNLAYAIYNAEPYVFGLVSSRMHMTWVRAVAGRLKTDFRYSSAIVYNNFPVPSLSQTQKDAISDHVLDVLSARENHSEKTLAEMYDPDKMPWDLKKAHMGLDDIVERSYRGRPFESDEERLSYLFKSYEKLVEPQKELK